MPPRDAATALLPAGTKSVAPNVVAIDGGVPSVVVVDRAGETLVSLWGDGSGPHPRRMYGAG
jgi:hypothetical protein